MAGRKRRSTRLPGGAKRGRAPATAARADQYTLIQLEDLEAQLAESQRQREMLSEAVQSLEESLARHAEHYDLAPVGYVTFDGAGVIREINQMACRMLQVARERALGGVLKSFVATGDLPIFVKHLAACRHSGGATSSLTLRSRDGALFTVEAHSRRAAGRKECYPTSLLDVTERLQLRSEKLSLIEATRSVIDRSQAQDQFFAMVGHELRGPLTPVLAAVASLERSDTLDVEGHKLVDIIKRNAIMQARLVDDLLDATRLARGKMAVEREPTDLHAIVREAAALLAEDAAAKNIAVEVQLDAAQDRIEGDSVRLGQVFRNLVKNALKFTPRNGRVEVRSWSREGRIAVEVSDNGAGLDPEALARLFQPFQQLHEGGNREMGLGLGLSISKGLVELHGGTLVASSAGPGRGARFVVELPLVTPVMRLVPPPSRRRLLLVEDNPDTAEALRLALVQHGYQVDIARSVAEGLLADLTGVDVVVTDLTLPDGDGRTLWQELRRRTRASAIALSGFDGELERRKSREAGFSAHLGKPIQVEVLSAAIERAARGAGEGATSLVTVR